jgi:hypothetical protein
MNFAMPIDGCQYSFQELATDVLPRHMIRLRESLIHSCAMIEFMAGKTKTLKKLGHKSDFPGCYVLIDVDKPIYVGISRGVFSRLQQHVRGKTHFDASLAYRIASVRHPHKLQRQAAMKDPSFINAFRECQTYLRSLTAAFIQIDCPIELYLFEVYASLELKTNQWNTFRTH